MYGRFNDNVFITPNAIDFREWGGAIVKHPGKNVRVLYTGAANHQEDFLWVRKPLEELQQKHDNVTIVFVGTDWKHMGNDLDYNRVEVHEWVDIAAYPYLMKSLACHIGIAPISESSFNDCRDFRNNIKGGGGLNSGGGRTVGGTAGLLVLTTIYEKSRGNFPF